MFFSESTFIFSVENENKQQTFYRVFIEGNMKFRGFWKGSNKEYERINNQYWMHELAFRDGENGVEHTIVQNGSSGKEKCV